MDTCVEPITDTTQTCEIPEIPELLPEYYKNSRIISHGSIDYLTVILDDIRNYRTLNKVKMAYVSKLSNESKQLIIRAYNDCMAMVEDILKE